MAQRITWIRWEVPDPFNSRYWTAYIVQIYKPSYDYPHVTVLYSMANGGGKCKTRYRSVKELLAHHHIPEHYLERLYTGETYAWECLEGIREDIANLGMLKKGAKLVDIASGEILNEAERILKGES